MWDTLIMQPWNYIHSPMHIHLIIHLHTVGARTLQHPWRWPHRQSSKEATAIESDSIHPTPISWAFQVINELLHDDPPSHARTHTSTSTDLQQIKSRRDDVLITWLRSEHHLLLKAHHWPRNCSYVSTMSASRTHTTTMAVWVPSGRCYLTTCFCH